MQKNCIWLNNRQSTRKYFAVTLVMLRRVIISRHWSVKVNEWKSVLRCSYRVLVTSQKLTWSVFSYICSYSACLTCLFYVISRKYVAEWRRQGQRTVFRASLFCSCLDLYKTTTYISPKLTTLSDAKLVSKKIIINLIRY